MPQEEVKDRDKGKKKENDQARARIRTNRRDATSSDYGLLQALQTLTSRAAKKPNELFPRLQTLVEVAQDG